METKVTKDLLKITTPRKDGREDIHYLEQAVIDAGLQKDYADKTQVTQDLNRIQVRIDIKEEQLKKLGEQNDAERKRI